jgi:hypothetical protein
VKACGFRHWIVLVLLTVPCIAACKRDAQVYGSVTAAGKGVPGARITLECPDGTKRGAGTNSLGDFRFAELGASVDDACTVEAESPSGNSAQTIATRCVQRDASSRCIEARCDFQK